MNPMNYSPHQEKLAETALSYITDLRRKGLKPKTLRLNPADYDALPRGATHLWGVPILRDLDAPAMTVTAE